MGQTVRNASIRVSIDGKAQTIADWKAVGDAGTSANEATAAAADKATAALSRQEQALARQVSAIKQAAMAPSPVQSRIDSMLGIGAGGDQTARASASAMASLMRQGDAVRAAIDPAWAAEQKLAATTASLEGLMAKGAITATEHAAAIKLAKSEFEEAEKAARLMAGGVGFSSMQMQELGAVAHRTFDSLAAGAPIGRVVTMEGARLGAAFASGPQGIGGILKYVGAAATSTWGILGTGALVIGGLVVAGEAWADSQSKVVQVLRGTGAASQITFGQLNAVAEAQARALKLGFSSAREMDSAFAATGRASADSISGATAAVRSYVALTGDAKGATAAIAGLFTDPAKGAEALNAKLDFLNAAELEQVKRLEEQGDRAGALKLALDRLGDSGAGLERHMGLWAQLGHGVGAAFSWAADKTGEFAAHLLGIQAADPAKRLADIQQQIADQLAFNPGDQDAMNGLMGRLGRAQADLRAEQARQLKAAANQKSLDVQGLLDQADPNGARIRTLQEQRKGLEALLASPSSLAGTTGTAAGVKDSIGAVDKEIADLQKRRVAHDAHAESLKRELAAMQANTAGSLAMAQGYLVSDAAGAKAEATRKAVTDATRKGGDLAAFVAAQLQDSAAQEAASAAKGIADLRGQVAAREILNAKVAAGVMTSSDADKQLQLEAQLRPLVTAMTYADAQTKKVLADEISRLTALTKENNAALATGQFLRAQAEDQDTLARLKLETSMVADLTGARERALAVLQAEIQARKDGGLDDDTLALRAQSAADVASEQMALRKAEFVANAVRSGQDSLDLAKAELGLIGKTQAEHDAVIDRLRAEQQLKAQGIDLSTADAQAVLRIVAANDQMNDRLRQAQSNWAELKSAGDTVIDDLFNPSNWDSWGDLGKRVIQDLISEFAKLELANPLKNYLFGENLPTGGGVLSSLGSLFSGGGAGNFGVPSFGASPPAFASGTGYSPSDWATVDEKGGELIGLGRGATVVNSGKSVDLISSAAAETLANMRGMAAGAGGGAPTIVIHMPVTMDNRGVDAGQVQQIGSRMDKFESSFSGKVVNAVNDAWARGMIRPGRSR